jgi:hypothetical protein
LWDLKKIQQHLTADVLQLVKEVNFAAHALKTKAAAAEAPVPWRVRAASSRILSRNVSDRIVPLSSMSRLGCSQIGHPRSG